RSAAAWRWRACAGSASSESSSSPASTSASLADRSPRARWRWPEPCAWSPACCARRGRSSRSRCCSRSRSSERSTARTRTTAAALAIYVGWRYAYFGELLPNTVRCKTGHDDRFVLLRAYWSAAPLVLLVALIQPLRSLDARVVLPLAVAAGYAIALIGADPLIGHELRHFLAAHALVCVLASVAAVRLLGLVFAGLDARASELSLVVALLLGATPLGDLVTREHLRGRAGGYVVRSQTRAALGRHLARELGPGERAVLGDVGVAGWE